MTKAWKTALILLAIACVIAAAVLVYSRPMTIPEICGVDVTKSAALQGSYSVYPVGMTEFEMNKDDARFAAVMELLSGQKFRRSVRSLLPQGTKTYPLTDGVFKWDILCEMREPVQIGGESVSGTVVRVSDYYREIEIECVGKVWQCRVSGQEQWLADVLAALQGGEAAP